MRGVSIGVGLGVLLLALAPAGVSQAATPVALSATLSPSGPGAPLATTDGANDVTASSVTLTATVNPQGAATTYHFEWGTTNSYGASAPQPEASLAADGSDHHLTQPLTGLDPHTTYYYRAVATSAAGTTYGEPRSFTTSALAPSAVTDSATDPTESSATLGGTANAGNSAGGWHFDYGKSATYGSSAPAPDAALAADGADHAVSQRIAGLEPNTTYHFRLVASGAAGVATGAHKQFKTASIPPDVVASDATDITPTAATLGATVNPHNSDSTYHFEWGETADYGSSSPDADAGDDNSLHAVALPLDALTPGTTYHYRVVASSAAGASASQDRTFTTVAAPLEPGPPAVPTPKIGTSVVASPASGTVRVRMPGDDHYTTLGANDVVPVGARIDTRHGKIDLVSALGGGSTQKATFWNGVFTVRQPKHGGGYVDLYIAPPAGCGAAGKVVAPGHRKRRRNSLWGHDNHGRFRSHGRGSIATVRGTTWLTEERCSGTFTKVKHGKVAVRDKRRHRTVLVRAGHGYLARTRP